MVLCTALYGDYYLENHLIIEPFLRWTLCEIWHCCSPYENIPSFETERYLKLKNVLLQNRFSFVSTNRLFWNYLFNVRLGVLFWNVHTLFSNRLGLLTHTYKFVVGFKLLCVFSGNVSSYQHFILWKPKNIFKAALFCSSEISNYSQSILAKPCNKIHVWNRPSFYDLFFRKLIF